MEIAIESTWVNQLEGIQIAALPVAAGISHERSGVQSSVKPQIVKLPIEFSVSEKEGRAVIGLDDNWKANIQRGQRYRMTFLLKEPAQRFWRSPERDLSDKLRFLAQIVHSDLEQYLKSIMQEFDVEIEADVQYGRLPPRKGFYGER